jgi:hypothetical protein
MFLWTGEAGDDDWHGVLNWEDKETGTDAPFSPGDAKGTETVEILHADVTVTDSPEHIKMITSFGSLTVNQPFTIEEVSTIEDLKLNSDLVIRDDLLLQGEPELGQSTVTGEGRLILEEAASGTWVPLAQAGSDTQEIMVHMDVFGTLKHGKNVAVEIKEGGFLSLEKGGIYKAKSGRIAYSENNIDNSMTSAGTIEVSGMNGSDPFIIESYLLNNGGTIGLFAGGLILNNEATYQGGVVKVGSGARLVFEPLAEEPSPYFGSIISEDLYGTGDGTILLKGNEISIIEDTIATFNMSLTSGGFEVEDGAEITGEGTKGKWCSVKEPLKRCLKTGGPS